MINHLTCEEQLMFACCGHIIGSFNDEHLLAIIQQPIDFDNLILLCEHHRIDLLVNNYLMQKHQDLLPEIVIKKIRKKTQIIAIRQLELISITCRLHKILSEQNIKHLFLKGPGLGVQLYANKLLRRSNDIDLLVCRTEITKVHYCLTDLGYITKTSLSKIQKAAKKNYLPGKKDAIYFYPGSNICIELHWKTTEMEILLNKDPLFWINGVKFIELQGISLPVLSDKFNILYLCLHASKHSWFRAYWLLDILLLMKVQNLSPNDLLKLAKSFGFQKMAMEAFFFAYYWFRIEEYKDYAINLPTKHKKQLLHRLYLSMPNKFNFWQYLTKAYWIAKFYPKLTNRIIVTMYHYYYAIYLKVKKISANKSAESRLF